MLGCGILFDSERSTCLTQLSASVCNVVLLQPVVLMLELECANLDVVFIYLQCIEH